MKKTIMPVIVVIIVIIAGGVWYGMSQKPDTIKDGKKTIKVGYVGVLSGPVATDWGLDAKTASELAAEEINNSDGDFKIEFIFGDSQAKPEQGVTEFKRIMDLYRPDIMIVDASAVASAIAPLADSYQVPIIYGAVATSEITKSSPYLFRNFFTCNKTTPIMAEAVYNDLNVKKVAIVSQNETYGQSCAQEFRKSFTAVGGEVVAEEKFLLADSDYRTQLAKIAQTDAQAIYLTGYSKQLKELIKEMKELGLGQKILSEVLIYSAVVRQDILNLIDPPEAYFTAISYYGHPSEASSEFIRKYQAKYGEEPSHVASYLYDTVYLINKAAENAKQEKLSLEEALAKTEIDGVAGRISFDENRETKEDIYFVQLKKDGSLIHIK